MAAVPTVEIVNPDNSEEALVINASDFDPEKHVKWAERDQVKAPLDMMKDTMKGEPEMKQRDRAAGRGTAGWPSVAGMPKEKSEEKKEGV